MMRPAITIVEGGVRII